MTLSDYIGVPYVETGNPSVGGADCWGLVRLVYAGELGVELPCYEYTRASDSDSVSGVIAATRANGKPWREVESPQAWDLMLFKIIGPHPTHVGMYLSPDVFLHTMAEYHSKLQRMDAFWRRRLVGYWRYEP